MSPDFFAIAMAFFVAVPVTTPASDPNTSEYIITALGAGGLGAIAAATIAGLFSKRKLGAEATEIITKAASSVVERLEAELRRNAEDRDLLRAEHTSEIASLRADFGRQREAWRRVLQLHIAWDAIAIAKLDELGVNLPPAPPITPEEHDAP